MKCWPLKFTGGFRLGGNFMLANLIFFICWHDTKQSLVWMIQCFKEKICIGNILFQMRDINKPIKAHGGWSHNETLGFARWLLTAVAMKEKVKNIVIFQVGQKFRQITNGHASQHVSQLFSLAPHEELTFFGGGCLKEEKKVKTNKKPSGGHR